MALSEAMVAGDVSVASTCPVFTTWPRCTWTSPTSPGPAKFRLVMPLPLTVPVKERWLVLMIFGTYHTAPARQTP